jgi:dual specificity phosphatase 3
MADFNFVTDRLATGGAVSTPADVQQLIDAGITHVIDCRAEFDDGPLFSKTGVAYLYNGTMDDGQHKDPIWFAKSLVFAMPALAQPKIKVYAHCAAGVNRGPSTCYAILRALGFNPVGAEAIIRAVRPQVGLAYKHDADAAIPILGY